MGYLINLTLHDSLYWFDLMMYSHWWKGKQETKYFKWYFKCSVLTIMSYYIVQVPLPLSQLAHLCHGGAPLCSEVTDLLKDCPLGTWNGQIVPFPPSWGRASECYQAARLNAAGHSRNQLNKVTITSTSPVLLSLSPNWV